LWIMPQKTWMCRCLYNTLTFISSDISIGVVSLDHMTVLFLVFWKASILLSRVVVLACIPTSSVWGFLFPHILATICCLFS
jgi:hypothetical protein